MAEKTCYDCFHNDVCENRSCWIDPNDSSKHTICHHFKNAADVVEVVRCKDCKHYKLQPKYKNSETKYCCRSAYVRVNADDFCSYGKRKEAEK